MSTHLFGKLLQLREIMRATWYVREGQRVRDGGRRRERERDGGRKREKMRYSLVLCICWADLHSINNNLIGNFRTDTYRYAQRLCHLHSTLPP